MATKEKAPESEATDLPKTALKIDKAYPFVSGDINHVVIVGCGGTGSYVIPGIARLLFSLQAEKQIHMTFIDADDVEEKNLIRQNFSPGDVGRNKAEALMSRYSGAFGLNISYRDAYLETKKDIQSLVKEHKSGTLFVSCVDNIRTRLALREAFLTANADFPIYWIDTGNESEAGQVVLSTYWPWWAKGKFSREALYPIPDIFDLYPELKARAKEAKFTSELSCAELAESHPQYGFVNHNAANFALNFAFDLIKRNPIKVHAVEFSIKNKFAHKPLQKSSMEKWKDICDRYAKLNMTALF